MAQDKMQKLLAAYKKLNHAEKAVQFYQRKLQRLYQDLPEGRIIRQGSFFSLRGACGVVCLNV